jgi:hypothetical protein
MLGNSDDGRGLRGCGSETEGPPNEKKKKGNCLIGRRGVKDWGTQQLGMALFFFLFLSSRGAWVK